MDSVFYVARTALQSQPCCGSLLGRGMTGTTHQQSQKTEFYWPLSSTSMPCFKGEYGLDPTKFL